MKKFKVFALAVGTMLAAATLWSCGGDDEDEPPYNGGDSSSRVSPTELCFGLSGGGQLVTVNDSRYSATVSDSWIKTEDKGYGTLRVYVDGYQSDRSGQIYITLSDNTRATVSVVQSSKYGEYPEPPVKPDDPDTPDNPDKPDNPGTTTIAAPKNVKAGFDYINDKPYTWVSWDKSYSKSYTYKVYRSTSANGSFSVIATTSDGSISDNNVSGGRTYYYKVKAFDSNGNSSDFSETVSVSVQSVPDKVKGPNKPVITSVTANRSGQLTIKWKVNSHPTCDPPAGFELLVSNPESGRAATIDTMGKNATSVSFSYGMWLDKDGWVKGAIKAFNDGGTETATFVYNYNTGQAIY